MTNFTAQPRFYIYAFYIYAFYPHVFYTTAMIIHVDMDAFYASVEEREAPELKGKPLVVAGAPESRGVVAAANYAARKFGVRSAMPTSQAMDKCKRLIIIPPRGELYAQVSRQIRAIFIRYTPLIEPLSLDEAFLDPAGSEKLHGDAIAIGRKIKTAIQAELNLVASVGIAPNKFLAKLASDQDKPDGFTVIHADEVQTFLDSLAVTRISGVGKVTYSQLRRFGIMTIADLRKVPSATLDQRFGKYGQRLWNLARGIDKRAVISESETKSVSHETTFPLDIIKLQELEASMMLLCESVATRLRKNALQGRTITIKIRFAGFKTITRSQSLITRTFDTDMIWQTAKSLLQQELKARDFSVRLIGLGVSGFTPRHPTQTDLFASNQNPRELSEMDQLADKINQKFGDRTLQRGTSIKKTDTE